jgi:pimeloyl-ACP methyl ester carboxylesterase
MRVLGSDGPPIVLLHGLGASGDFWGGGYDALASGHRVVVPDLPGFGRRPWPASRCRVEDHADALARSLLELGLGGDRVLVVAHSFGALVALALSRRQPDLVRGVIVFSVPLTADIGTLRRVIRRAIGSRRRSAAGWVRVAAQFSSDLAATSVPVRLVIGTRDAVTDLATGRSLAERNRNVGIVAWHHADHHVAEKYPAACRVQIENLIAGFAPALSIVR